MRSGCACAFLVVLAVGSGLLPQAASAKSGSVAITDGELWWGQYLNHTGVVAIGTARESGGEALPDLIKDYPVSGVSCVLLRCQRPGAPFFTPDGGIVSDEALERLRRDVHVAYRFDMLPIVVLFDPDPSCRLEPSDAYARAATTIAKSLSNDYWFLPCVTDACGDERWQDVDSVALARTVAAALHEQVKGLLVAAGGNAAASTALLENNSPINVIVQRTTDLSPPTKEAGRNPVTVIDVVAPESVTPESLAMAIDAVLGERRYGFAVDMGLSSAQQAAPLAKKLNALRDLVDAYQKEHFPGSPPDPADTTSLKPGEKEEGFVSLFNGRDLTGWVQLTSPGDFVVKDGVIRLVNFDGGWLRSWHEYGDFVFRAEYKIIEGGNSGLYIRAPLVGRQSRIGFEFQIRGQAADAPLNQDCTGSIYDVRPPDANCMKPNEWNEVEITCVGETVKIVWNGQTVHDFKYSDVDLMKHRAVRGYIGLQDHHNLVEFRNLRIKRLD